MAVPMERVADRILSIRGHRVILDADLAELYGVTTFHLNEAVKRNRTRFPEDFTFQMTAEEFTALKSQFAISKPGRGGRRTNPYVFTEEGVATSGPPCPAGLPEDAAERPRSGDLASGGGR